MGLKGGSARTVKTTAGRVQTATLLHPYVVPIAAVDKDCRILQVAAREQPLDSIERSRSMKPISKLAILAPGAEEPALTNHELPSAPLRSRVTETLTARECDILALIGQGFSNKSIARMLTISPETVKSHVKRIFLKLGVGTRAAAVSRAVLPDDSDVQKPPQEEADSITEGVGRSSFRIDACLQGKKRN
jgi:DNA-binding CsgD family transcriptional regulator